MASSRDLVDVAADAGSCPVVSGVAGSCPVGSDAAEDVELYRVDSDVAGSCPVDLDADAALYRDAGAALCPVRPDADAVLYRDADADVVAALCRGADVVAALCPVCPDVVAALYRDADADVVAELCPVRLDADAALYRDAGEDSDAVLYPGVVGKSTRLGYEDDGDESDEYRGADARPAAGVDGYRDPGESPEVGTREEGPCPGKLVCDYNYSRLSKPGSHTRNYCGLHARLGHPVLALRRPFVGRDERGAHDAHARVHNRRRSRQVRE